MNSLSSPWLSLWHRLNKGGDRMIILLCWIIGCYGLAGTTVHLLRLWTQRKSERESISWIHVVLVVENDECYIEWIIRAYYWSAWVKGHRLYVTCVDRGSTDATFQIIACLANKYRLRWKWRYVCREKLGALLHCLEQQSLRGNKIIIIKPQCKADWIKVPFHARRT